VKFKMNHVGISVSNLDEAIAFYANGFGMSVLERSVFSGEQYDRIMNLARVTGSTAVLRVGDFELELFEFIHPSPRSGATDRPVCDQGITHFCIEVDDIDRACERLKAAGARFHCAPIEFAGVGSATYGRDPDGNVFELFQSSKSQRYLMHGNP
jgi:catechol 2,3-dioxygenase-like lactoylglutathione lyase family enzyme